MGFSDDSSTSLPPSAPRRHVHTRTVEFKGYRRDDGLWDIEAELIDSKPFAFPVFDRGVLDPGEPVHGMTIRVTVDDDMVVKDVAAVMPKVPFPQCRAGTAPLRKLIGAKMGPGWRAAIDKAMGGTAGCTHLRALLFNAATAAYQTIPTYREHERRLLGMPRPKSTTPPSHLGRCVSWAFDGKAVQRFEPEFYEAPSPNDGDGGQPS